MRMSLEAICERVCVCVCVNNIKKKISSISQPCTGGCFCIFLLYMRFREENTACRHFSGTKMSPKNKYLLNHGPKSPDKETYDCGNDSFLYLIKKKRDLMSFQVARGRIRDRNEVLSGTYKMIEGYPRIVNSVTASTRGRKGKK